MTVLQYYGKQTYTFDDHSALTTDVTKSLYQVPFGATLRCRFLRTEFQPYLEAKIGTEYSEQNTFLIFLQKDSLLYHFQICMISMKSILQYYKDVKIVFMLHTHLYIKTK